LRKILFFVLFLAVVVFFIWSELVIVSLGLVFIIDSITTRFLWTKNTNISKISGLLVLRYFYLALLPLVLIIFVRVFFVDIYFVPSSSMEATLFPKDYVVVNKVGYGVKLPRKIQDIPVFGAFFRSRKKLELLEHEEFSSLRKYKNFELEDIVVFKDEQPEMKPVEINDYLAQFELD
jgi:signal peptidase I